MVKVFKTCLDLISRKKTYSTDINMLTRKPPFEKHQMLPYYENDYKPKQNSIDFESAKEVLTETDIKKFEKRQFERIYNAIESMTYTKYKDIPEHEEIFIYGFKHVGTAKVDKYILIRCESDELFENDKLFNFWSNNFIIKDTEMRNFKNIRVVFYDIS